VNKPEILVVDDDADLLFTVRELLLELGFAVRTAANGREALQELSRERPAAVLLDMRMPVMDGWGFAAELRKRGDTMPLVVMTAATDARSWAEQIHARAYVSKPFEPDEIVRALNAAIGES
jgi:two-component system chemotaxis response regulator CheY